MVRVLISTGEVSGDLQGSLLVEALHRQAAARGIPLEVLALGGPRMQAAGAELLADTCLLYTSPSPRDMRRSRMPSSA